MKKFTLLMASAMIGISASAQLYVCGNKVNGASNWNPGAPVEVALTDGFYEFKAEGDFKMSTSKGDWNDFNANAKGVANNDQSKWEAVSDTESKASLVAWLNNTSSAKSGEEVSYKVNEDFTEITATYSSGAIVYNVYLAGSFNEYNAADANYKFTATDNADEYKYEWKGEFTKNFKVVVNGTWYGTYDPVVSGETYVLYDTHDTNCTFDRKAVDPVFVFNVQTLALTVTYTTGGDDPQPPVPGYDGWYVNLMIGGEGTDVEYTELGSFLMEGDNVIASFENMAIGTNDFEFRTWDGSKNMYIGNQGEPIVANGEWMQLYENGGHCKILDAAENSVYNVEFNLYTKQVKVSPITVGVSAIEAAATDAVYFNMQGVRVANPEKGLFIRVQNGKAVKVVK